MLNAVEVAALELAVELEEAIKMGHQFPAAVVIALHHLRTAQLKGPHNTEVLEQFYKICLDNRPKSATLIEMVPKRRNLRLIED